MYNTSLYLHKNENKHGMPLCICLNCWIVWDVTKYLKHVTGLKWNIVKFTDKGSICLFSPIMLLFFFHTWGKRGSKLWHLRTRGNKRPYHGTLSKIWGRQKHDSFRTSESSKRTSILWTFYSKICRMNVVLM